MLKINIDTDINNMLFIDYMNNKSENDNEGKIKSSLGNRQDHARMKIDNKK